MKSKKNAFARCIWWFAVVKMIFNGYTYSGANSGDHRAYSKNCFSITQFFLSSFPLTSSPEIILFKYLTRFLNYIL